MNWTHDHHHQCPGPGPGFLWLDPLGTKIYYFHSPHVSHLLFSLFWCFSFVSPDGWNTVVLVHFRSVPLQTPDAMETDDSERGRVELHVSCHCSSQKILIIATLKDSHDCIWCCAVISCSAPTSTCSVTDFLETRLNLVNPQPGVEPRKINTVLLKVLIQGLFHILQIPQNLCFHPHYCHTDSVLCCSFTGFLSWWKKLLLLLFLRCM